MALTFNGRDISGQPQQPQQQGGGGFNFEPSALIAETGGAGGAALGAGIGTALLPGIGTLIGGGLGGFLGGFGGSAAEQQVRDNDIDLGEALGEGAWSGVFGAGPLRVGKAALGTRSALKTGAAKTFGEALKQGGKEGAEFTIRGALGSKAAKTARDSATKQFGLTGQDVTKFANKFSDDPGDFILKKGFSSVDDVVDDVARLNTQFTNLVKNAEPIKKSKIRSALQKTIKEISDEAPSDSKRIAQQLSKEADGLLAQLDDVVQPQQAAAFKSQFDKYVNYNTLQNNPSRYDVNKKIADSLRGALQEASKGDQLKTVGREMQKTIDLLDVARKRAGTAANRGGGTFGLRTLVGTGVGTGVGGMAGGPAGAIAGGAITAAANSPAGKRAMARGAQVGAQGLTGSAGRAAVNAANPLRSGLQTGARVAGSQLARESVSPQAGGLEEALISQSSMPNQSNNQLMQSAMTNSQNNVPNVMSDSLAQAQAPQQAYDPYAQENIQNSVQQIMQQGGGFEDVAEFLSIAQAYNELTAPASAQQKPLTGEALKRALTSQSGLRSLDILDQTLAEDPGAFQRQALPNPLGITARLTDTTDIRAATQNVVDVIARLRSGAAITPDEARRFAQLLPQPGDSQEAAARKLQMVRSELTSFVNPQEAMGAPTGTLEEALLAQQGAF